jgi:small subunit ribosomal protein S6
MAQLTSLKDAPGTKREYETIFILRPEASTENIQEVNARVRRIIEGGGGRLIRLENWGKRKLAYEIRNELKGIYLYWLYLGASDLVAEVERNLRMLDVVIRYNTVRVDQDVNPDARPTEMDEESFLAAATTVPDEEDTYLGRGQPEAGEELEDEEAMAGEEAGEMASEESQNVNEGEPDEGTKPGEEER